MLISRWYFPETKRLDAEKMLLAGGNLQGAFLIRNCESQKGELSLSGKLRQDSRSLSFESILPHFSEFYIVFSFDVHINVGSIHLERI